jgi:predicted RNA-binding Zn-ribbon protein involved in translation (DUF1610 family)
MWSVSLYCDDCGEHISNCGVLKSDSSSYEPGNPKSLKMWYEHTCPKCGKVKHIKNETLTTEDFIKRARAVHGDKYDYS